MKHNLTTIIVLLEIKLLTILCMYYEVTKTQKFLGTDTKTGDLCSIVNNKLTVMWKFQQKSVLRNQELITG